MCAVSQRLGLDIKYLDSVIKDSVSKGNDLDWLDSTPALYCRHFNVLNSGKLKPRTDEYSLYFNNKREEYGRQRN